MAGCAREPGITDDVGRRVEVPLNPRRVVTLAPNLTELVFHVGAGNKIVGTDDFSNMPPAAATLPKVGGLQPNSEMIMRLEPDLVLASSSVNHPALAKLLDDLGIPMYVVRTDRLSDIPRAMSTLGRLLGTKQGDRSAADFDRKMTAQRRTRPRRIRVLLMVWPDPLYVAGHNTFVNDLLTVAGAENALPTHVTGWPQISLEPLLVSSPDLIIFPERSVRPEQLERLFNTDSRWREVRAIREKKYLPVDEDLFTRPGPRLPAAAAALNQILDQWEAGG